MTRISKKVRVPDVALMYVIALESWEACRDFN